MSLSLEQGTALCRLLADASRLRLLLLLDAHELTVAELTQITRLAQSRVSTHLARLQRAGIPSGDFYRSLTIWLCPLLDFRINR